MRIRIALTDDFLEYFRNCLSVSSEEAMVPSRLMTPILLPDSNTWLQVEVSLSESETSETATSTTTNPATRKRMRRIAKPVLDFFMVCLPFNEASRIKLKYQEVGP